MPSCRRGALAQVDRGAYLQQRVAHVAVEQRPHPEVADGHVGFCGKVYFAVYARHAPVVGIFEVTAVRPFENLHGERVLARSQQAGDVEFRGQAAVLGISCQGAVDPDVITRVYTPEVQHYPVAFPASGYGELSDVASRRVVACDRRRPEFERIGDVGVYRIPVALHLPARGNLYLVPVPEVGARLPEPFGALGGVFRKTEFPDAVERHHP